MKLFRVGLVFLLLLSFAFADVRLVHASEPTNIVISQVQAGGLGGDNASLREFISLYNRTETTVELTNWCLKNKSSVEFACFLTPISLEAYSYLKIGSSQFAAGHSDYQLDIIYEPTSTGSGSLVGSSDIISLYDDKKDLRDSVSWSTTLAGGAVLERMQAGNDCQLGELVKTSTLVIPVDCEVIVPVDACLNIDDIQLNVPAHAQADDLSNCYIDTCIDLPGFQDDIPEGYEQDDSNRCLVAVQKIEVTELLANPEGDDSGNEFIELYNPNDKTVDLSYHVLHLNDDFTKSYKFAPGTLIAAKEHLIIKNSDVSPSFTLTNSSGSLRLRSYDGTQVADVPRYGNAPSGESWALIGSAWQYTPILTPSFENRAPVPGQGTAWATQADCGEGRERNPTTNRCRNITTASVLAPCKEDQYRSEETNRCRSIATAAASALKPCADNQFRSPLTNRCRTIASSDDPVDCGEGRERNPTTNRCRNILGATSVPAAGFSVQPVKEGAAAFIGWWALGGVMILALGYAGWEWRREISNTLGVLVSRFSGKR